MTLQINGAVRELPKLANVAELVEALALPPATLLVEHNRIALRREEWASTPLADGDRIELLRIAAGG